MDLDLIAELLTATPGWQAQADGAGLDRGALSHVLSEAGRFAEAELAPLAALADREGCRVDGGRVRVPAGYRAAYLGLGAQGWLCPDLPEGLGGSDLPVPLHIAASLPLEGAAMPFMMAAGSSRAGAHLLAEQAPALAREWCPQVAAGAWALTICISEPEAGSDVGRIRTRAVPDGDDWRLDGTKCWISFGDHDMTDRIGHLALARTGRVEEGTRGLSLFLVPDRAGDGTRNGVHVERIEEKLGLHGSPTCVLRFEEARGTLIGAPGRGLAQLFTMIELMRLQVGAQGAALALESAALARRYAQERRQGGRPDALPPPIATHPDVHRQLTALDATAAVSTAAMLEAAVAVEAGRKGDEAARAYAAFLLPLAKTFCGEGAQTATSAAIQVLGGAGYTREWKAERLYRDARILTIYEGTTGMQGQDFLFRRLLRDGAPGLRVLRARIAEAGADPALLHRFESLIDTLATADPARQAAAADGILRAGWAVTGAFLATRIATLQEPWAGAARHHSAMASARMSEAEAAVAYALTA